METASRNLYQTGILSKKGEITSPEKSHDNTQKPRRQNMSVPVSAQKYPQMVEDHEREKTFKSWPNPSASCLMLAFAGFFYSGKEDHSDEVTCHSCGVKLKDWKQEDLPLVRHSEASPNCPFVVSQLNPKSEDKGSYSDDTETSTGLAAASPWGRQYSDNSMFNKASYMSSNSMLLPSQSHSRLPVPVQIQARPLFQSDGHTSSAANDLKTLQYFQDKNMRIASFYNSDSPWPPNAPISPEEMAEAGLFYTGQKDKVQCAYCRGKLYNWAEGDTAFGEHKRHFPKCSYVILKQKERNAPPLPQADAACEEPAPLPAPSTEAQLTQQLLSAPAPAEPFDVMHTTAVKSLKGMGYNAQLIANALQHLLTKLGISQFSPAEMHALSTTSLLESVWEVEGSDDFQIFDESSTPSPDQQITTAPPQADANKPLTIETAANTSDSQATSSLPSESNTSNQLPKDKPKQEGDRIKELEEENSALKNLTTCRVCYTNDVNILFLPCRHLVCCESCGYQMTSCPLCRATVVGSVKTFLA